MKTFNINNKTYIAREFDFNTVCELEEMGHSLEEIKSKPLSTVRAYFALCVGGNTEYAGKELGEHMMKGGTLSDVIEVMSNRMEESDFFRSIQKDEAEENTAQEK